MSPDREKPPFLRLLLLATVCTPVGLLLTALFLSAFAATIFAPLIGTIYLYNGDILLGSGLWLLGVTAFFVTRFLKRKIWESPNSFL